MTANRYSVRLEPAEGGWEVKILEPGGGVALTRACGGETEARTFASTVDQHIKWLSEGKFRQYYRLLEPG